ncbi:MAG: hypothetical protein AMXMBFR64_19260 [Myxococcales bacterium]
MKIAFTHNLQIRPVEEQAEFDRPETVEAVADALRSLGHDVDLIEVSGPAARVVARLEALGPDLVFNTAEGEKGRTREAFYPGLFEQLGLAYTGSDPYTCALTLDKHLTKLILASHGVPTPRWVFVDSLRDFTPPELWYPLIVKPNFEGSSKGVTLDSIVEEPSELLPKVRSALERFPSGVLIEEFVRGRDVVIPYLEKASPATGDLLAPSEYEFDPKAVEGRKYRIYDYSLKHGRADAVRTRTPAELPPHAAREINRLSRRAVSALGLRDYGRLDWRVALDGRLWFLEANALPSLEPGAALHSAACLAGLDGLRGVLEAIVRCAAARFNIPQKPHKARRKTAALRVGLAYNLKRVVAKSEGDDDAEAEYDSPKTIGAIREAIASYGHEVVDLEATPELPVVLQTSGVDVVFNLAEGMHGRNRESQVPAMLELLDIPYTGSDPATLSLTLDKALAKRIVRQAGLLTPEFVLMTTGKEKLPKGFRFPVIAKPLAEGSSKGVTGSSVARDEGELRALATQIIARYRQPALVEEFMPGREFTVALLGEVKPRVLPPMEIVFLDESEPYPTYAFEHKLDWTRKVRYDAPANVDQGLGKQIEKLARSAFTALGCRDLARIDLRCDAAGRPNFIECNPLPGLTPDWSDLCLIATAAGMDYRTLIGEILAPAIRRFRERERQTRKDARGAHA